MMMTKDTLHAVIKTHTIEDKSADNLYHIHFIVERDIAILKAYEEKIKYER